jgi:hypothetical protein
VSQKVGKERKIKGRGDTEMLNCVIITAYKAAIHKGLESPLSGVVMYEIG